MRWYLTIFTLLLAGPSLAQEKSDGWSIGGLATIGQSIYLGDTSTSWSVFPDVSYDRGGWRFGLSGIAGNLYQKGPSTVELVLQPRFFDLIGTDVPELAGIDRDVTGDIGANWFYDATQKTAFAVKALQEVTGEHNGQEVAFEVEQEINIGRLPLWLAGTLTWQSDGLADYLYGVTPSEATATRSAYAPGSVVIPSVSISSGFPLGERALLFGSVNYEVLPDRVTSSPIVARDDQLGFSTGISLTF